MKKYNPNYSHQLKIIDKAMENINKTNNYNQQSHNSSFNTNSNNTQENLSKNNYYTNRENIWR